MTTIPFQRAGSGAPVSLTQRGHRPSGQCTECGSARLTTLAMTLTDGTPVQFSSCHDCENRSWRHEGAALAFDDVLARATKQKV